jgi:hypothetical protein
MSELWSYGKTVMFGLVSNRALGYFETSTLTNLRLMPSSTKHFVYCAFRLGSDNLAPVHCQTASSMSHIRRQLNIQDVSYVAILSTAYRACASAALA